MKPGSVRVYKNTTLQRQSRNLSDLVLRACELKKDIFNLPRCDATIVGENGMTLSGGQRARICLARALYQYSLSTGGKIVDRGTYEELVERSSVFSEIKRELEEIRKTRNISQESMLFNIIATVSSTFGGVRASLALHHPLVTTLMRAPLSFFEETPLGRILNRLVGDIDIIDRPLPINIRLVVDSLMHKYFLPTNRQIKRIESAQRSQVLAALSQNFEGAESIRAYGKVKSTLLSFNDEVDSFTRCRYLVPATARWLALRLELLGNIMLTDMMNFSVRMMAMSDANVVAVERIKEYHDIEGEREGGTDYPLLDSWPHSGAIEIHNFSIRYGNSEKCAVKNVTLSIKGGEKVAIVGRTGSGKTSIARGLLRLTEKSGGDVFIDGVNISDLSLHELRSRITIIPQDPVLFSSTLRFNVDPFYRFADSDIWLALEACQLKEMVSKREHGLMAEIEEGGKNISIGERQLLCLCRALLEGGAILILDEATASLDHATQALVDTVVREHFRHATTITIAHKLETIGECD
ncbi:ABC transporter, ATP-binding protein, partial [Teladorsagia circumcincta]